MRRFATILGVSIVLLGAGWAQASLTTVTVNMNDYVVMSPGSCQYVYNGETGGEFGMTVTDSSGNALRDQFGNPETFYTFCADPITFMNYSAVYKVGAVTDTNWLGYQLSDFGKWIYYEYAEGSSQYILGHGPPLTSDVAGAIQEGIWQQLTKTTSSGTTTAYAASGWIASSAITNLISAWSADYDSEKTAGSSSDWQNFLDCEDAIGIAHLQLNGADVQNQMVLTLMATPYTQTVPEPATMIVWSLLGTASWLGMRVWRSGRRIGRPWSEENRAAIRGIIEHGRTP